MIKLKQLLSENKDDFIKQVNERYPIAGPVVDGREVMDKIDNLGSISASLNRWFTLDKIREVSMSEYADLDTKHYSVQGTKRIAQIAKMIEESKTIMPLIMVVDQEGSYILEGSTRIKNYWCEKFSCLSCN